MSFFVSFKCLFALRFVSALGGGLGEFGRCFRGRADSEGRSQHAEDVPQGETVIPDDVGSVGGDECEAHCGSIDAADPRGLQADDGAELSEAAQLVEDVHASDKLEEATASREEVTAEGHVADSQQDVACAEDDVRDVPDIAADQMEIIENGLEDASVPVEDAGSCGNARGATL